MNVKRVYVKTSRTPKELAKLRAVREKYQQEKPSPEEALAASEHEFLLPLGALLELHQLFASLKRERERAGITLAELARRSGIDSATLSKLETGKQANPTFGTVIRYSGAIGKQVCCLLQDAPGKSRKPQPA